MTELRQNPLNGNWTLIAPERKNRPREFEVPHPADSDFLPEHDPSCPFCPDNEERFPLNIFNEKKDGSGKWITRTLANKYKLFDDFTECPSVPAPFRRRGIYSFYEACGNHLVVVEGRSHNKPLGAMSIEEIRNTLSSYRDACRALKVNANNRITILFKNQGVHAGASQRHAHSQIVGSCIVPAWMRNALHVQDRFYDDYGTCALCTIRTFEAIVRERMVFESSHFDVISPYAASAPYEVWLVPKRHFCCYEEITGEEIADLGGTLKKVLWSYITKLGNPDYNYLIHTTPHLLNGVPSHHMYFQVSPRFKVPGGFESGTRIPVNTVWPEDVPHILAIAK